MYEVTYESGEIRKYPTYGTAVIALAECYHCSLDEAEQQYGMMIQMTEAYRRFLDCFYGTDTEELV